MSIIKIVRRNIMFKPLQSLVACCVVMASIAMAVLVLLLADGVHSGLTAAAEPFPIVAGSKGSPNQLVLNTVFLKDTPMSNISYTEVEKLRANKNVAMAVQMWQWQCLSVTAIITAASAWRERKRKFLIM